MDHATSSAQNVPRQRSGSPEEELLIQQGSRRPGSKAQGHKRTKTGCLTCRKRRIKCGEERPACQNCVKSKRQCAGYNQRVVFKDPINIYRGPQGSSSQASGSQNTFRVAPKEPSRHQAPDSRQPSNVPRPLGVAVTAGPTPSIITTSTPIDESSVFIFEAEGSRTPATVKQSTHLVSPPDDDPDTINRSNPPVATPPKPGKHEAAPSEATTFSTLHRSSSSSQVSGKEQTDVPGWSNEPTSASSLTPPETISYDSNNWYKEAPGQFYPNQSEWPHSSSQSTSFQTPISPYESYPTPFTTQGPALPPEGDLTAQRQYQQTQPWDQEQAPVYDQPGPSAPDNQYPIIAPVDMESDDPFDVTDDDYESDDSFLVRQAPADSCTMDDELGVMVAFQADQVKQDLSLRSITSFIDRPNMLSTYIPSHRSSPLNNSMTARIFSHFIHVTAASISMYERHPANPSLIFEGVPVPRSQQSLWTYTIPMLALRNDALLHALLALAALHIAKLQNNHITASLKHYSISLRRIAKSVSHPTRQHKPSTLAASLVLSLYECWCADHQKWSNHLLGARMLLKEIDFVGITKYIKSLKMKQRQEEEAQNFPGMQQTFGGFHEDDNMYQRANEDVDENIVGMLMGKRVQYDQYGQILDDDAGDVPGRKTYTEKQLQDYDIQRDLFWWYCKMDAYHSILGGGRLFMEYDRWSHCPPRAPIGRLSATYGTYDHLMLVIGRVADFTAKDLKRKRLAWKANAERRPPEGSKGPKPPQPPPFSGMMPNPGEAKLPMGFEESFKDDAPQNVRAEFLDLEAQRVEAEEEWHDIMNAFSLLEDHFGDDFQALGPEFSPPIDTPFGPALQYRTYAIAGIWLNYYMALIVFHRAHPSMPPAAMMASRMAAKQTAFFANQVGRISAGIAPHSNGASQVTPGVGAALIETSFCLFIAGVQYQDHGHRSWTINRLLNIARLTGWQSSHSVITGCEGSWTKLAELGRGPPYTRTTDQKPTVDMPEEDTRKVRRIDKAMESGDGKLRVQETDRAHFAIGLLGFEDDFDHMILESEEDVK